MKNKITKPIYLVILFLLLFSFLTPFTYSQEINPAEIFLKRHSYKAYDPTLEVNQEQMLALISAAKWAPSSHNDQPWNFIFCDKTRTPEAYLKAFDSLKETQQAWVQDAPLLVVVVARTKELHKGKMNEWAEYDTGAAGISMALQASELGLMAHQIGGFDKAKIKESFQLPENHKPLTIMVIGYEAPGEDSNAKPRTRRPINENFFLGEWNRGIEEQE